MERQKIFPVLFAVLLAAAVFLGITFFVMYRNINYLPEEGLADLCEILEKDRIFIDRSMVSLKKKTGTVYVCAPEEYGSNAAVQLGESEIKYRFAAPDGEIILLNNRALCEFKSDFRFRYRADQTKAYTDGSFTEEDFADKTPLAPEDAAEICAMVEAFLEKGSSGFDKQDQLNLGTEVTRVCEKDGVYYVECVRTIDDLSIAGNRAVCVVRDGIVAEAVGTWCFLTLGESYFSQLTDIFNILFSVKKEIVGLRESEDISDVTVTAIDQCYILYYLGENGGLCFVPCWKIVTDVCGDFVFNAIDGSLCTE